MNRSAGDYRLAPSSPCIDGEATEEWMLSASDPDAIAGGSNACVQLSSGVWGMIAGDCNGDGGVTALDQLVVSNQVGQIGYLVGDVNLDGEVSADDVP